MKGAAKESSKLPTPYKQVFFNKEVAWSIYQEGSSRGDIEGKMRKVQNDAKEVSSIVMRTRIL